MDIENLDAGQEFDELPDTYTIFIIEEDFFKKNEALYPIERINLVTGKSFEDGEHILYVNGEYRGNSEVGKLMHDFNCTDANDMNYQLIAERTRYLKENPEGVKVMCKAMEDMRNEAAKKAAKEATEKTLISNIKTLMQTLKLTADQAMDALRVPQEERGEISKAL